MSHVTKFEKDFPFACIAEKGNTPFEKEADGREAFRRFFQGPRRFFGLFDGKPLDRKSNEILDFLLAKGLEKEVAAEFVNFIEGKFFDDFMLKEKGSYEGETYYWVGYRMGAL